MDIFKSIQDMLLPYMSAQTASIISALVILGLAIGIFLGVIKVVMRIVVFMIGIGLVVWAFQMFNQADFDWIVTLSCLGGGIACLVAPFKL